MILTEKQLTTQEAIIKRLYPGVSMEEIKEKEFLPGCKVIQYNGVDNGFYYTVVEGDYLSKGIGLSNKVEEYSLGGYTIEIIGLPPTLSRVLTALGNYCYLDGSIFELITRDTEYICKRKLLNEDMTECSLRDQSIETQDIIYNILCKD